MNTILISNEKVKCKKEENKLNIEFKNTKYQISNLQFSHRLIFQSIFEKKLQDTGFIFLGIAFLVFLIMAFFIFILSKTQQTDTGLYKLLFSIPETIKINAIKYSFSLLFITTFLGFLMIFISSLGLPKIMHVTVSPTEVILSSEQTKRGIILIEKTNINKIRIDDFRPNIIDEMELKKMGLKRRNEKTPNSIYCYCNIILECKKPIKVINGTYTRYIFLYQYFEQEKNYKTIDDYIRIAEEMNKMLNIHVFNVINKHNYYL